MAWITLEPYFTLATPPHFVLNCVSPIPIKTLQRPKGEDEKRSIFKSIIGHYQKIKRSLVSILMKVIFLWIAIEHTARAQKVNLAMESMIGRHYSIEALLNRKLLVCKLDQKAINADIFMDWMTYRLLPKAPDNSVFILDHASFDQRKDIKEAIISAG